MIGYFVIVCPVGHDAFLMVIYSISFIRVIIGGKGWNKCTCTCVTGPADLFLILGSGEAGDCQGETLTMSVEYTVVSSLLRVVCISKFLALCSNLLQSTDLGIQKKTFVNVWLLVCSSELAVLSHYAHMPLKQILDKR